MKAAIYARVSTDEQAKKYSVTAKTIQQYACLIRTPTSPLSASSDQARDPRKEHQLL